MSQPPVSRRRGIAAALITVVIWTSFIVIARASSRHTLAPLDIAFLRFIGAGLALAPVGWWLVRRHQLQGWLGLSPYPWRTTVLVGCFGSVGYGMLAYAGFFYAPAAHGSVLMPGSLPLWTTIAAAIVLGERITGARVLGLSLIVAGDLLVGGASLLSAFQGGEVWKGDLLFMSAASCWAIYTVLTRRLGLEAVRATVSVSVFALVTFVPVYGALALAGAVPSRLALAPWGEILFQALYQGLGSVVISGITFTLMVQHFGPVRSTMMTAVVPGLSALAAVLFLGEPLGWNLLAGLALVTLGIVFGVRLAAARLPASPQAGAAGSGR